MKSQEISIVLLGFVLLILPLAFLPITQDPEITIRFLFLSLGLTTITAFCLRRNQNLILTNHPVFFFFAAYSLVSAIAVFKSINPGDGIVEAAKNLIWLMTLLILAGQTLRPGSQAKIATIITCSSILFSCIGLYQLAHTFSGDPSTSQLTKLSNQIASTLSNKNFFSETLLLMLPLAGYLLIKGNTYQKITAIISILLSAFFIVKLQSIAVFIAGIITLPAIACVIFFYRKKLFMNPASGKKLLLYGSGLLLIGVIVMFVLLKHPGNSQTAVTLKKINAAGFYIKHPDQIFKTELNQNDNSLYDRIFLAVNSIHMAAEHPATGSGIANWRILLPSYGMYGTEFMAAGTIRFEHPHNDYLFILCETGCIGLLAWLGFLVTAIIYSLKLINKKDDDNIQWMTLCILAGIISFAVLSMFSYPKERFFSMMMLITYSGILISFQSSIRRQPVSQKAVIVLLVVLAGISFINFQRYTSEIKLFNAFKFQKKGNFHQMQKSLEEAHSAFHILDMTSTPLSWHLGQSYYYQGNTEKAFSCYMQAVKENPFHMQALNDLGALYESKGDHKAAMNYIRKALNINPSFENGRLNLVAIYFNTGEIEKAFQIMLNIKPWFTPKWSSNMKSILLAKATKVVQTSRDTVLAEHLNNQLKIKQYYLVDLFISAEKDSVTFENKLTDLSKALHH